MTNLSKTYTGQAIASLTKDSEAKDLSIRPEMLNMLKGNNPISRHTQGILTHFPTAQDIIPSKELTNGTTRN